MKLMLIIEQTKKTKNVDIKNSKITQAYKKVVTTEIHSNGFTWLLTNDITFSHTYVNIHT